jgi:hypothetical protein
MGKTINKAKSHEKSDFTGFEVVIESEDKELEILITADGKIINKNVVEWHTFLCGTAAWL